MSRATAPGLNALFFRDGNIRLLEIDTNSLVGNAYEMKKPGSKE